MSTVVAASYFHNYLRTDWVGWRNGRPRLLTVTPLVYTSERLGTTVVIPAEFITDGASVPRLLLTWWLAGGRAPRPAVLHDWPYQTGYLLLLAGGKIDVSRAEADALFLEAMAADPIAGTGFLTRPLMYAGVRAMGWTAWKGREERATELNPIWSREGWPSQAEAP